MFKAATLVRTCLAGLALAILSASLAGAAFGPRTTIGKSYQQTSNTTSLNGINPGSCGSNQSCYVLFQLAPSQQPLIVQHIACALSPAFGGLLHGTLMTRTGQTLVLTQTPLLPVRTSNNSQIINSPVMHLLKPGERAVIRFVNSVTTTWGLPHCSLSGRLQ
jgi:hypothetical protein